MIRAELMEDGKTIATEGRGNADQIMTELKCMLHMVRVQMRGDAKNEEQESLFLMRLNAILGSELQETRKDLKTLSNETKNKVIRDGIRKSMKIIEKFERSSEKARKAYAKEIFEKMEDLAEKRETAEKPDPEQEDRATQAEDELKRRLEEE